MSPALSSPASAATEGTGELAAHQTGGLASAECPGLLLSQVPLQTRGTALGGHPGPGWLTPPGSRTLILSRGPRGQRQSREAWPQGLFPSSRHAAPQLEAASQDIWQVSPAAFAPGGSTRCDLGAGGGMPRCPEDCRRVKRGRAQFTDVCLGPPPPGYHPIPFLDSKHEKASNRPRGSLGPGRTTPTVRDPPAGSRPDGAAKAEPVTTAFPGRWAAGGH
uniref:Uncharacterized protein n=1 Tax=Rhinolophus ferrumequinum TaxID=59479 RepID=A0A671FAV8_RHIFE